MTSKVINKSVAVDESLWLRCRKKAKDKGISWPQWVQNALRAALNGGK